MSRNQTNPNVGYVVIWMVLHANVWLGYKESVDSGSLTSLDLVGTRNGDVFVNENP